MRLPLALALILSPLIAGAEEVCPPNPDHAAEMAALFDDLRVARDETEAQFIMDALWQIWTDAPDEHAQMLLDKGMERRESYDFLGAREVLDELVEYCPNYAEGYNQRAFASFLRQDYPAALHDIDTVLDLLPNHLGALSGKALTLMGMGRMDEAQKVLRQTVRLHPWMRERSMIVGPPEVDL